jgi:probable HAF family extracellular repeat protein
LRSSDGFARFALGAVQHIARRPELHRRELIAAHQRGRSLNRLRLQGHQAPPGASGSFTLANGINNSGQVVGEFSDAAGATHTFIATPNP